MVSRDPNRLGRSAHDEEFDRFEEKALLLILFMNLVTVFNLLIIAASR